ncbi:MAG: EscU/YscU/HrcU family type III secretion system export apparatus switch protein [Candidatus Cloacimonetes bacterium]|nr:EscU/YscU/HrcU family type III secretion system export apparatus switch protein [Candidatus Cloacimonadota bacterium]
MCEPKKPQAKAVALLYDPSGEKTGSKAPVVVAKGSGFVAEKIIARAKENNVVIEEEADLVEILCQLDLGQQIPDELYSAVAKILARVYVLNEKLKNKIQ